MTRTIDKYCDGIFIAGTIWTSPIFITCLIIHTLKTGHTASQIIEEGKSFKGCGTCSKKYQNMVRHTEDMILCFNENK